ncbi:MAG: ABC transporter ATP-binding protein [Candidatus Nanohaloarchaeota archaeon QJJ-5]|nr:ABC transporter ATP-binding protein [Candidatus Nanohaloarchaeota archaeon QJJ-5]
MTAISTDALRKEYGDVVALDGLSLSVEDGELYGLLGPNGAGKTTMIEILTGQIKPTAGTASVLGTDPVLDPVGVREKVGILPEREDPPSFLTPREYFEFVCDVRDVDHDTAPIDAWVERVGLEDKMDTLNKDLSKGEKQKVMIAQTFLHEPELVFIDEPLINLDPVIQERVKSFFESYRDDGNTIFLCTHVLSLAEELCTKVAIIENGRLEAEHDADELRDADDGLVGMFLDEVE